MRYLVLGLRRAVDASIDGLTDNRALAVACYEPGYTLVEKLQTISTKFRRQQQTGDMPANFLRHYYDVNCLLGDETVQAFIGTEAYQAHKLKRFPTADEPDLLKNPAFRLDDGETRALYAKSYAATRALYYQGQPAFEDLMSRISAHLERL